MNRHARAISQRLSLREPQRESLEILDTVCGAIDLKDKNKSLEEAFATIHEHFPKVESFERDFPSLCFSLATGVGKTRLMGAFITYLHLAHGIRNFFVLAPNLTIYEKLVADFTPNTPKYVFKGIAEFAVESPWLITGDNYEEYRGNADMFGRVEINIFNISKLNRDAKATKKGGPKIRNLQETLGESYFDHLKSLPDLVLLMDECHRYRADAGVRALNELKPLIGLELTATPFLDRAAGPAWFKNIIYDYPLASAIEDGFVKDPAVATQVDFDPTGFDAGELERLKLEDGIRLHEETKIELDTYARQTGRHRVKPFMLVIARDTTHAAALKERIEDSQFFGGAYAGKVIQVDSTTKKQEEEVVARLLKVEHPDEPTEIVIHVNMLKEGWDVNNLFTIVPLRAANARTLIEQSIGRGLRLPYGLRTGVEAVDRLTIVAHDKFQEIIEEANKSDNPIRLKTRLIAKPEDYKKPVQVISPPVIEQALFGGGPTDPTAETKPTPPVFTNEREKRVAKQALNLINRQEHQPSLSSLRSSEVEDKLVKELELTYNIPTEQGELEATKPQKVNYRDIIKKTVKAVTDNTIAIPRITVVPTGEVTSGYDSFEIDLSSYTFQTVKQDILLQYLSDNRQSTYTSEASIQIREKRPEDYIVRQLINYDDINYDTDADLLYELSSQIIAHLTEAHPNEDDLHNVLRYQEKQIANNLRSQMQDHFWEKSSGFETRILKGWLALKPCPYNAEEGSEAVNFRVTPKNKREIRKNVYTGFARCLYPFQKFDSDAERRFAEVLENDATVLKWFKPASNQFSLQYRIGKDRERSYEPDFVVESKTHKYLVEVKADNELESLEVTTKADAGKTFCEQASEHADSSKDKPWDYLLVSDSQIASNRTLKGLI